MREIDYQALLVTTAGRIFAAAISASTSSGRSFRAVDDVLSEFPSAIGKARRMSVAQAKSLLNECGVNPPPELSELPMPTFEPLEKPRKEPPPF